MKKLTLFGILFLLLISLAACNGDKNNEEADKKEKKADEKQTTELPKIDEGKVVAKVNGKVIKGKDYNAFYQQTAIAYQQQGQDIQSDEVSKTIKQQTLDSLIGRELLVQDAKKKGYKSTEEEVNQEIEKLKANYQDEEAFNKVLKDNNLTLDELKDSFGLQLQIEKYIDKEVKIHEVTDKEVEEFYNQYVGTAKDAPALEDVKPQIKQTLEQQDRQNKVAELIENLKKDSEIEILI